MYSCGRILHSFKVHKFPSVAVKISVFFWVVKSQLVYDLILESAASHRCKADHSGCFKQLFMILLVMMSMMINNNMICFVFHGFADFLGAQI